MPRWSPNGRAITFIFNRPIPPDTTSKASGPGLWELTADCTSQLRPLWSKDSSTEGFWSPDGRWLVLVTAGSAGASSPADILAVRPGVDSVARHMVATRYDGEGPALSPDSHWLAYDKQGQDEVFVRPFPNADGGKWQVTFGRRHVRDRA